MTTDHDNSRISQETEQQPPDPADLALADDVRWFMGSQFLSWFTRLAFDETAYREIAAAGDRGGRYAENLTDRSLRSHTHVVIMTFGDTADVQAEMDKMKTMHQVVHGHGKGAFADTRFSALNPDAWKWVLASMTNMNYQAYIHTVGRKLDARRREIVFQTIRSRMAPLELSGRGTKIPETLAELTEYYDEVATAKLADNEFLQFADRSLRKLPVPAQILPPAVRFLVTPIWRLLIPLVSRPTIICSTGAAHPRMRELLGDKWTWRNRLEFACYKRIGAWSWRHAPRRFVMYPMAYNRYQYERMLARYRSIQLDTFAPLN